MGEVKVLTKLENFVDLELSIRGDLTKDKIRRREIQALVDTGCTMLVLPQDIVDALGLRYVRKAIVSYADERKEERDIAGVVALTINSRQVNLDCIVGPPASEALIGQVVLEEMDLLVDPKNQRLSPRPESPELPLLKLK